ncbi:hypothetical protein [Streptomyces malaysiensis]|uniref:hypothetical protein n=1 Tax=Streptomyces malaysiensis TaxID=92644 RepID=UPI0028C43A52|nr:hypothetical protein [Streptomyces malaysiensis]
MPCGRTPGEQAAPVHDDRHHAVVEDEAAVLGGGGDTGPGRVHRAAGGEGGDLGEDGGAPVRQALPTGDGGAGDDGHQIQLAAPDRELGAVPFGARRVRHGADAG